MSPPLRCSPAVALLVLFCAVLGSGLDLATKTRDQWRGPFAGPARLQTSQGGREIHPETANPTHSKTDDRLRGCSDLVSDAPSGIYLIWPGLLDLAVHTYCDNTEGAGWTVIQRRANFTPLQDFYQDWEAYKWGLGDLDRQFYWGNEFLWLFTQLMDRSYELYVHLEDFDGNTVHALYQDFQVASEDDNYRLTVGAYSGDAGDSLTYHSGSQFSTKDRDNDGNSGLNCAETYQGAWWYNSCYESNLNGVYLGAGSTDGTGVTWRDWKSLDSLKTVVMKIRPT